MSVFLSSDQICSLMAGVSALGATELRTSNTPGYMNGDCV